MALTDERIMELRRLDAARTVGDFVFDADERYDRETKECWWEQWITAPDGRTVDLPDGSWKEWRFLVAAANCVIPALDEIARLTEQNNHLLSLLWKVHNNNKRGLSDGVREEIESLPYVPPWQPPAEEGVTP